MSKRVCLSSRVIQSFRIPARKKGPVLETICTHLQAPTTKYRTKTARLPCQKRAISMGLRATRLKMELSAFNSEAEAADE